MKASFEVLPHGRMEASRLVEEGDVAVAEWTLRATFTGTMVMPDGTVLAATGKSMQPPGVSICEIRNGQFTSVREYSDLATVAAELGIGAGAFTDTPGTSTSGSSAIFRD